MLKSNSSHQIARISQTESEFRNDFDQSFLSARISTKEGVMFLRNKKDVQTILDDKVSNGDILFVPSAIDYIELIGGIQKPGLYKYIPKRKIRDYCIDAEGYSENSRQDENMYIITKGLKLKIDENYIPNRGDIIFIEENIGYRRWDRFVQIVGLTGTLSTLLLVILNF